MPTIDQFFRNMAVERMLGLKPIDSYGDEHLSDEEARIRRNKTDIAMRKIRGNSEGNETLGHFVWNELLQDWDFIRKEKES